jgi:hypothetical protein
VALKTCAIEIKSSAAFGREAFHMPANMPLRWKYSHSNQRAEGLPLRKSKRKISIV